MNKLRMDKLIDDIIELILGDMDCHHDVDHDEDGIHTSVEYNLNNETKLRGMIRELIEQHGRSELRSKCHGAEIKPTHMGGGYKAKDPNTGLTMKYVYQWDCCKCHKPCEVEEREEVGK